MSASVPGAEGNKCDPNLTPLLDVVLQLVMFFMLCAHFVTEKVNEKIKLPTAIEAKSLDKSTTNYIILNIDEQGTTTVDAEVLDSPVKVQNFMKNHYDIDKARTKPADWEKGKGRSLVILRAHKDCNYKMVHDVMSACRRAQYTDIQLRAIKSGTNF